MSHPPTIKQLKYLVSLEEHLHFGKAAQACFVTQAAFSLAIKELESHLGLALVDRNSHHIMLTEAGHKIAELSAKIILDLQDIIDVAKTYQEPLTSHIKMGIIPTIAPFLLPTILPKLRSEFPKLKIYLKEDQTKKIHHQLINGELDILLLALPYELPGTESIELCQDEFRLAFHADTTLIDHNNYSSESTPPDSILLLEDGHCLRDHAISACDISQQEKISAFSASSLYTLMQMVDNDLGISFIPQLAIDSGLIKNTHIKTQALADNPHRVISLMWRKNSLRAEEFITIAKSIKALL